MSLEFNKIASAVLIAGLTMMAVGKVADAAYRPETEVKNPGFAIEVAQAEGGAEGGAAAGATLDVAAVLSKGDAAAGEKTFKKCAACHTADKGGPNRVGPNLWGIVGASKAHAAGFAYSDAMKAKGGTWTGEDLAHFLNNPKAFVPSTKMSFAGLKKEQDLADVIAYLKTLK